MRLVKKDKEFPIMHIYFFLNTTIVIIHCLIEWLLFNIWILLFYCIPLCPIWKERQAWFK